MKVLNSALYNIEPTDIDGFMPSLYNGPSNGPLDGRDHHSFIPYSVRSIVVGFFPRKASTFLIFNRF